MAHPPADNRLTALSESMATLTAFLTDLRYRMDTLCKRVDMLELTKQCGECGFTAPRLGYSKKQWAKANGMCNVCAQAIQDARDEEEHSGPPTEVTLTPRPLMGVPGFEGQLSVCRDWPQTKKGRVPGTQSAVFVPLIACVLGPIEGYFSSTDLALAMEWWSLALPAWPRWVKALQDAGLPARRDTLLKSAKGPATPLIFRAKGRGKVPHIKGKEQTSAIEMDMTVALEVYACCQVLYSIKNLDMARAEEDAKHGEGS
eukprot:m.207001 g.207001  ORF g.207001 m.207001 type:complete len:258 (+) comp23537_c0_seq1:89-862(+)